MFNKVLQQALPDEVMLSYLEEDVEDVNKYFPVNHIGLEYVISKAGLPLQKIVQIAGFPDTGKTLLSLYLTIQFQKFYQDKGLVVYIDTERAFPSDLFVKLGGNKKTIGLIYPKSLEAVFQGIEKLIENIRKEFPQENPILIVIDSLSLAVEKELEEGGVPVGTYARYLSAQFRRLRSLLPSWNATLLMVSQNKEKVSLTPFGGGVARLGGHAVEFAPVLTLELKRVADDKEKKEGFVDVKSIFIEVKATKNHLGYPFRKIVLKFDFDKFQFDEAYNIFHMLLYLGKIEKKGGWYAYQGKSYRESELLEVLRQDNAIKDELRKEFKITGFQSLYQV
ncbi:MAG: ATPase domain-containing protein [Archaeoglobaceae archaeon]